MKTIIVPQGNDHRLYQLLDPGAPSEIQFTADVVRALARVYANYHCILFSGSFSYEGETYQPDLALVAKDYSHWFVIEVELVSHSLTGHVLPQVKAFCYGHPQSDCVTQLARELKVEKSRAMTLLSLVPYAVVVVANKRDAKWELALAAHGIQLLTVSTFRAVNGDNATEIEGYLEVLAQSLGFGSFSATDRSLRFDRSIPLPSGSIQIYDPSGTASLWTVARDERFTWVTKEVGVPDIENGASVQLRRTLGGRLSLRRPAIDARLWL
jgi:hypothetical protein